MLTSCYQAPTSNNISATVPIPDGGNVWDRFKRFIPPPEWLPAPTAVSGNTLFASSRHELVIAQISETGEMTETLRQDFGSTIWDIKIAGQKLLVATEKGVLVGDLLQPNTNGTLVFSQPGLTGHLIREIAILAGEPNGVFFALVSPDLGLVLAQQFGNDPPVPFFQLSPLLTGAKHVVCQPSLITDIGTIIVSHEAGISIISVDLAGSAAQAEVTFFIPTDGEVRALSVSDNVAYWAVHNTLFALQLPDATASQPTQLFSLPLKAGGMIEDLFVSEDKTQLYVSNGLRGVSIVDISDPQKPAIVKTYTKFGGYALSSHEFGDILIVSFTTKLVTFNPFRRIVDELSVNRLR